MGQLLNRVEIVPSRDLNDIKNPIPVVTQVFLPQLVEVWKAIEQATGYRWRATSYLRNSPSHKYGVSLDITPNFGFDILPQSDPVLFRRIPLLTTLIKLAQGPPLLQNYDVIIAVESDHIHIQLFELGSLPSPNRIVQWRLPKPVYADTITRQTSNLPLQGTFRRWDLE